MNTAIIIRFI